MIYFKEHKDELNICTIQIAGKLIAEESLTTPGVEPARQRYPLRYLKAFFPVSGGQSFKME